jgi:hypothetical protein
VQALEINRSDPSILYLGAGGVFKSTDTGNTWSGSTPAGLVFQVQAIAIDPTNPSIVYAGGLNGVVKTTDGGASWTKINLGLTTERVEALSVNPKDGSMVYLGASIPLDAFVTRLSADGTQLVYSTMIGGMHDELGLGIAVGANGRVVTTGFTASSDYPTVNALQPNRGGIFDVFVAGFESSGIAVFSTYLGGSNIDFGTGITLDGSGNVYVTGETQSINFPLANPLQSNLRGTHDAFLAKLSPGGSSLTYSTYLGGTAIDQGRGIAVDSMGNAYMTGITFSADFPTTAGVIQPVKSGNSDLFISKLSTFDACVQDELSGRVLLVDTRTGSYQYQQCTGITLTGTGTLVKKGCLVTIQANAPDRRILVRIDTCSRLGTAAVQYFPQGLLVSILDRNIGNNTCRCAE